MSGAEDLLEGAYGLAWRAAMPFLASRPRLTARHDQRMVRGPWPDKGTPSERGRGGGGGWRDLWLHAASGGEAQLAWTLLQAWREAAPNSTVLATSLTDQGLGVLDKALAWAADVGLDLAAAAFPYDAPHLMRRAMTRTMPKAVALLETELWPGLLVAARAEGVPVAVVNGRLNRRSLARYLMLPRAFWRESGPARVLAVSRADASRFALLLGEDRVDTMPNIKFDRALAAFGGRPPAGLEDLLAGQPFCVLGSVRREEEEAVAEVLGRVLEARPKTVVGLFPKHLERVDAWTARLETLGLPHARRSALKGRAAPGAVVVWDSYGELAGAYAVARAAFVGGSLAPLGGQNLLEPLAHGVVPVIGPSWRNFSWVGEPLFDQHLAHLEPDAPAVAARLVRQLARPRPRQAVMDKAKAYVTTRAGGAAQAAALLARLTEAA